MLGVCIGVGDGWAQCAARTARRMERMTNVPCVVVCDPGIYQVANPSWLKCKVIDIFPNESEFMVFDADIFPNRPWNPVELMEDYLGAFMAVPEKLTVHVAMEAASYGIRNYVNAGLTLFTRHHKPIWDYAFARHPQYGRWLEQTALNEGLEKLGYQVVSLADSFNKFFCHIDDRNYNGEWLSSRPEFNLHATACGGAKVLDALQKALYPEEDYVI